MTAGFPGVSVTVNERVATIMLSDPPENLGSVRLVSAITTHVAELEARGARAVILRSSVPGYFVAHADPSELLAFAADPSGSDVGTAWLRLLQLLRTTPMVVVAEIDGQAWGGGAELVAACDLVVASHDANFAFPEARLGLVPGAGGVSGILRRVGYGRALALTAMGLVVDATTAERWGLVDFVSPPHEVRELSHRLATAVAGTPPEILAEVKSAMTSVMSESARSIDRAMGKAFLDAVGGEVAAARISAWVDWRLGDRDSAEHLGLTPVIDLPGQGVGK